MNKELKKALEAHLKTLWEYQQSLFAQGHTFWYCDSQDESHKKPFYYYQINKSVNMATCSTCQTLMENRKKIRAVEKQLGLELTPFYTNHREESHVKNVSVKNKSDFNPNYAYMG